MYYQYAYDIQLYVFTWIKKEMWGKSSPDDQNRIKYESQQDGIVFL